MKAAYTEATVWTVDAECLSPLRTGGADGSREEVLRSHDGRAMLQGSSLAGCLRGWLERNGYAAEAGRLFGTLEQSGSLRISDGLFAADADMSVRPRLRIDGATGTAEDGKKYDVAHMETGSRFSFTAVLLGETGDAAAFESALSALNGGRLALGAQKTNGFGRVRLAVRKRGFDLKKKEDRDAWLADETEGETFPLPAAAEPDTVSFTVEGTLDGLLVKAAQPEADGGHSYAPNLREAGRAVLPGSSVKGALRARAKMIAGYMGCADSLVERVFGADADAETPIPGKVVCEDAYPAEPGRKITRIRINKFTGGVIMRGGLFKEEPVSGRVTLNVSVDQGCPQGCALVLYALRDLGLGLWSLGSGGAIGRGYLKIERFTAKAPDGRALTLCFDSNGCRMEDPDALAEEWISALKEANA